MITKEDLAKFIKEAIKEGPFDGCMYVDLGCQEEDSRQLYLVLLSDREGDAVRKIGQNWNKYQ